MLEERLGAEGRVSRALLRPKLFFGADFVYDAYWRLVADGDGGPQLDYRSVQSWLDRNATDPDERWAWERLLYAVLAEHRKIRAEKLEQMHR